MEVATAGHIARSWRLHEIRIPVKRAVPRAAPGARRPADHVRRATRAGEPRTHGGAFRGRPGPNRQAAAGCADTLLAAAYALKLGLTSETYESLPARTRRKETVIAGIATAYTLFLIEAAGLKFVLLATILLAPATLLYVKARHERGRRLFTPTEIVLCALIIVCAVIGVVMLWTGRITI